MPQSVSSPTMMTTPKPHSSSLKPSGENGDEAVRAVPAVGASAVIGEEEEEGVQRHGGKEGKLAAAAGDGRITPTGEAAPSAGSAGASTSASSAPSSASLPTDPPSPNPTTISSLSATTFSSQPAAPGLPHATAPTFNATISHPAEIGMGSLHGEEQLKSALSSKDRMFILVLANEFEAFIGRIATRQVTVGGAGGAGASTSVVAALGPSTPLGATPTSKFQRMLVYKAAEWYGLKAVPGPEGSMIIGVLGTFHEKSNSLRLSDLVPAAPSPTQKFRIMQRAPPTASNPSDAGPGDGPGAEPRSKWKTLEEREAAYAAAREKFLGKDGEVQAAVPKSEETSRAAAGLQDDIEPVPRRRYPNGGGGGAGFEPVYPSLYRPAKSPHHGHGHSPGPAQGVQEYAPQQQAGYFQNGMYPAYPVDMYGNPVMGAGAGGAYAGAGGHQPQAGYMPPFMDGGQYAMMPPGGQQGGYQMPGWQAQQAGGAYPQQMMGQNGQYGMMQQQQQGSGQWAYTPMMGGSQPMPMIPQGMPYHAPAFFPQQVLGHVPGQPLPHLQQQRQPPQQQLQYPPLAQPTPTRPQPQPHSSASSSISSRSYQDGSRPHSRGSTTSTRSAASGVRLGAIYSVGQGAGYSHRQKGMKQQGSLNGLTSLGMGSGESKRGTRGHSPSSVTTTSSQSSRRTGSIQLAPPTQHQLPQRPDWAANNVPYHPSPMLGNAPVLAAQSTGATVASSSAGPNVSEFPPLLRASTAAEPMQVERAKAKQLNGTVWNGSLHHSQPSLSGASVISAAAAQSTSAPTTSVIAPGVPAEQQVTILPGPSRTPNPHAQAPTTHGHGQAMGDADTDFPRRVPGKSAPTLYDPSASTRGAASVPALVPGPAPASSRPTSAAAEVAGSKPSTASQPPAQDQAQTQHLVLSQPQADAPGKAAGPSPEEIIEAKLAAVSINAGVSIGPPPVRPAVASYAKIVRRD